MKRDKESGQKLHHNGRIEETKSGISLAGLAVDPQLVFELCRERMPQILTELGELMLALATHLGSFPIIDRKP
jgi:hypothetical protein